jgi:TfoX/Sxy family transcriptional regulator of competence genes
MAFDEGLAERIRQHLQDTTSMSEKRMFGGLAFLVNGNMCVGVIGEHMVARIGPDATDEALTRPGARIFDFSGRPMKGWISVSYDALEDDSQLAKWVEDALDHVNALPPK